MKASKPKKLMIMNILDILRRYTDAEHRLSQKDIVEILKNEYDMEADRKSVKRNIQSLIEFGYDINYSESIRMIPEKDKKTGEIVMVESYILSDFYLEREFSDSELRLLIDGILFSKHIPYSQCKELVEKIEGLSNQYFKSRVRYIKTLPETAKNNHQLFYTIEILDEAIAKGKQVAFNYCRYETDKKLHPVLGDNGKPREYIINPYQMAANNGKYYLICNNDNHDDVSNYRLDKIINIRLLDTPQKPQKLVRGLQNGLNLSKHMAENMYMFSGETVPVTFRAKKYLLNDIFDWFSNPAFSDETEDEVTVRVTVSERAMQLWAMQYALHIKILSPQSLKEKLKSDLKTALEQY